MENIVLADFKANCYDNDCLSEEDSNKGIIKPGLCIHAVCYILLHPPEARIQEYPNYFAIDIKYIASRFNLNVFLWPFCVI